MISVLSLLGVVLWPDIQSFLEEVSTVLEKKVWAAVFVGDVPCICDVLLVLYRVRLRFLS